MKLSNIKKWIKQLFCKHDYIISSYNKGSESVATFYNKDFGVFCSETEPEAIFKACQWILDNKEK
jgi:hypothetical protein